MLRSQGHSEHSLMPAEDDVIRLSAILLEDSYYEALHSARQKLEGVTIIDETLLIPLKARAFLDLTARSHAGHDVDGRNIRKHRNDVFRLAQLFEIGCAHHTGGPDPP